MRACFLIPPAVPSHGAGQDFDMTEFEVLAVDHCATKEPLSQPLLPSELPTEPTPLSPSLTPQPSPPSTPPPTPPAPEQPEEVGKRVRTASSSPQLRLIKRKAPEVLPVNMAAQLLPASCLGSVVINCLSHY